jgi:hypothetical protein
VKTNTKHFSKSTCYVQVIASGVLREEKENFSLLFDGV